MSLRRWLPAPLRPFGGYLLAVFWVGVASLGQASLDIVTNAGDVPFVSYFVGVILAAFAGLGPGLLAVAISTVAGSMLFLLPASDLSIAREAVLAFAFVGAASVCVIVTSAVVDLTTGYRVANIHLRLLGRIGTEIQSAFSFGEGVSLAASIPVPDFADIVVIDLLKDAKFARTVASVDEPPAREIADVARAAVPNADDEDDPIAGVIRTGNPVFWPPIADATERYGGQPAQQRVLGDVDSLSSIAVPITAHGQRFGVISFICVSRSRYEARDLDFALEMGRRIGVRLAAVKLVEDLREANEAKDVFLGMISHEMRTPLTIFGGYTETLQRRWDELPQREINTILSEMARQSDRLLLMVENMLVVARSEERRREVMEMEPVLLQRFLPDICREESCQRGRDIICDIDATLPPVLADQGYLRQVLQNLLSNADKYSPQGRAVEVRAERQGQNVRVIVADRGVGVAPEHADVIFEPFVRVKGGTTVSGAGLGLAVCQRLVEAMDGRMAVKPRRGGGSEFSFTVPGLGEDVSWQGQQEAAPTATGV